ncbi:hypothetical protein PHMEG_00020301 [Phytophthora megakarya]|uniref:Reverse transcriptase/retrotransposon-derived protein RNase H-like domain-containing protein n=1 Tax=Phytophthora megakarya TaxID=4795 RepID=A0A225VQL6_9STRA|nr:hypothetical protein PHMEG_00020301 [Phytophthora megakarya]
MEKVYEQAGLRKKNQVRRVLLRDAGWGGHESVCLEQCNESLKSTLQLSHPNPEKRLWVFTDASNEHGGLRLRKFRQKQLTESLVSKFTNHC